MTALLFITYSTFSDSITLRLSDSYKYYCIIKVKVMAPDKTLNLNIAAFTSLWRDFGPLCPVLY